MSRAVAGGAMKSAAGVGKQGEKGDAKGAGDGKGGGAAGGGGDGKGGKDDPGRDVLHKRLHTLQNVADPSGLKEAVRVLDLCNTDPLMLRIMEERVHGWESDVFEALPEEEREKFQEESRKAGKGSDATPSEAPTEESSKRSGRGGGGRGGRGGGGYDNNYRDGDDYPNNNPNAPYYGGDDQQSNYSSHPSGYSGGGGGRGGHRSVSESQDGYSDDRQGGGGYNNAPPLQQQQQPPNNNNNKSRQLPPGQFDDGDSQGRGGGGAGAGGINDTPREYRDSQQDQQQYYSGGNQQQDQQQGGGPYYDEQQQVGGGGRKLDRRGAPPPNNNNNYNYPDSQGGSSGRGGYSQGGGGGGNYYPDDSYSQKSGGSSRGRGGGGGGGGYPPDDGYYDDQQSEYSNQSYPPRNHGGRRYHVRGHADMDDEYDRRRKDKYRDRDYRGDRQGRNSPGRTGSAKKKKNADPSQFQAVDKHLHANARARLVDFYAMVNPEKVKDVDKILEAYNGEEETLFRQLHLKYVANLRNRLDPEEKAHEEMLIEKAKALGTKLPPPPPPEEVKLEGLSVDQLINQGNKLMREAPEPPVRRSNQQGQKQEIPLISNDSEVVPALEQLHILTEANLSLAQEVAVAEQSVLQSRFRVILGKCLKSFNTAPNHLLVVNDMHAGREFQVALSDATWAYLKEAVLDTPLIHANSVRVTVSASHTSGTTQVDRNILASALREWSAQQPHTVGERKNGGRWSFSTSRTAWWTWPNTPAMRDAVPGRSLIYPTVHREQHGATNLHDASFPSLRDLISSRTNYSPAKQNMAPSAGSALYDPNRQQPGYWDHFAHQMGVLQTAPELSQADYALKKHN